MNKNEKDNIIKRYNARFQRYGYSPKTLGWDKKRHNLRFHILTSQWNLSGCSILDFGCGFGDMFGYLIKRGIDCKYYGVDINKSLIEQGKKVYPGANLETVDLFNNHNDLTFDYIFSSGVHNLHLGNNIDFIKDSFNLFNLVSTKGFAINFLSNKVEYELDDTYHANPSKILEIAYHYSNRIVLRNDYMPFEFTVFVDKRNTFDKSHSVYQDFLKHLE